MKANPVIGSPRDPSSPTPQFLSGGGEMGALMRACDWSGSSLGAPETWPQPLRTVVRLMLNTGHPMYIWWGPDNACLYNDAYRASIGPERHPGSLGKPAREVWDEIWPIIGPQIEQVRSGRGATWHENALVPITRNGRREDVYWTYSYSPIDDESSPHGIGGVLVVCSETTQQVLAAQQLAGERDRLARLFDQAPTFMTLLEGPDHRVAIANPGYLQLVGRPVLGRTIAEALPDAVQQGYLVLLDQVYNSGQAYAAHAARYSVQVSPEGPADERFVDFVYQPIKDPQGQVTGIFVVGADVTPRTRAEQERSVLLEREKQARTEAEVANRSKDEFLAILGHELRNPLSPILNALYLMRIRAKDTFQSEREVIERQVAHMTRLVDDLLDVSRITSGRIELKREHVDMGSVVADAADTVAALMAQRRHHLAIDAAESAVIGDRIRLIQIITNLLTNAARYTPDGGEIRLQVRCIDRNVVVEVSDPGQGIAPDMLPRIFDLFVQGKQSLERSSGGLGLGLAIVRSLVKLHGGSISARSEGLGKGATFTVQLPAAPRTARGEIGGWDSLAPEGRVRHKILVVDDSTDSADMLCLCLEQIGYQTVVAYDGQSALQKARALLPHAAILDVGLPGMDGYELARQLRASPGLGQIPLIALTGYGQDKDRALSQEAGINCHLTKPVEPAMLAVVIERYLNRQG